MSLTLVIALNAVLDLAILSLLAFATTRTLRLRPHVAVPRRVALVRYRRSPTPATS